MEYHSIKDIATSINIAILPIIIIPVTGLCCLVFYNRLAALNNLIHTIYKEIIGLHTGNDSISPEKKKELTETFRLEHSRLEKRSNMIRTTISCCFLGLIAFILSAISIMLGLYWAKIVIVTLVLWMIGALSFALGLLIGMWEIKSRSQNIITIENTLMEKWLEADNKTN